MLFLSTFSTSAIFLVALASIVASSPSPNHHARPRAGTLSPPQPHRKLGRKLRTLPRQGDRLKRSSDEATVKCLTRLTFSLCAGDVCTDMGAVATGTACVNDAITWADAQDAPAASASPVVAIAKPDPVTATTSAAVNFPSITSTSEVVVNTIPVQLHVVKTTTTTSEPSAATSSASSTEDDGDDEYADCGDDYDESPSATSETPAKTSASKVVLAVQVPKTSATTTTTSTQDPPVTVKASVSLPAVLGDVITGGFATFFYQEGGYGACGQIHADSDKIVALQIDRYGTGSNNAPSCGKTVVITNTDNGKTVTATVADACPGCQNYNSLDLSTGAFDAIADEATGVVPISWYYSD